MFLFKVDKGAFPQNAPSLLHYCPNTQHTFTLRSLRCQTEHMHLTLTRHCAGVFLNMKHNDQSKG